MTLDTRVREALAATGLAPGWIDAAVQALDEAGLRIVEAPEPATLADGTRVRDMTARQLGIAAEYPSLRAVQDGPT